MSTTADDILRRFKEPWLTYSQGERICILYGFTKHTWAKMAPTLPARQPDKFLQIKRYSRDSLIELIESTLPNGNSQRPTLNA